MDIPSSVTIKYFKTFTGKFIPFRPAGEITKEQTVTLDAYYIATFEGKQLKSFEKILNEHREWLDEYTYWPGSNKLRHRRMEKADGSIVEQEYNRRGRFVRDIQQE